MHDRWAGDKASDGTPWINVFFIFIKTSVFPLLKIMWRIHFIDIYICVVQCNTNSTYEPISKFRILNAAYYEISYFRAKLKYAVLINWVCVRIIKINVHQFTCANVFFNFIFVWSENKMNRYERWILTY